MHKIKKGDDVIVITGRDKGKRGAVLSVRTDDRVVVQNVNMVKRHTKPNPARGGTGGIVEKEAPLYVSKVKLVCPKCATATRFSLTLTGEGKKARVCLKCKEMIDG